MSSTRRLVEDAVVALLASLKPATVKTVKVINADVRSPQVEDEIKRLAPNLPAVLVMASDGDDRSVVMGHKRQAMALNIDVLVVASSLRSREEQTRNVVTGGGAGAYAVVDAVHAALQGKTLDVAGAGRLRPKRSAPDEFVEDRVVWHLAYEVVVDRTAPEPTGVDDLTTIASAYHAPAEDELLGAGTGDSLAFDAPTVTLTDALGAFSAAWDGMSIIIAGATTQANNGRFPIAAVPTAQTIEFTNPRGVAEPFAGTWTVTPAPAITATETA